MITINRCHIRQISKFDAIDITWKSGSGVNAFTPNKEWTLMHQNYDAIAAGRPPRWSSYREIDDAEYIRLYVSRLDKATHKDWESLLNKSINNKLTFACYCAEGKFCHTHILIEYMLNKFPGEFKDGRTMKVNIKLPGETIWIGVIGSRSFDNYDLLNKRLTQLFNKYPNAGLITGTKWDLSWCPKLGADQMAAHWAKENNIPLRLYLPEWDKYSRGKGNPAGFIRNTDIANNSDKLIAFWDLNSNGTRDTLEKFINRGRVPWIVEYNGKTYRMKELAQKIETRKFTPRPAPKPMQYKLEED
jgi:uncharacterized protein YeaO (DUF488 family)